MSTPLIVRNIERDLLRDLRERAAKRPVDMLAMVEKVKTLLGKDEHMQQMTAQSIEIPIGFIVTFSIESGHPCGTCRHMSMSSARPNHLPSPEAVWLIAKELGFTGSLEYCRVWIEELGRGKGVREKAVNVVQPLDTHFEAKA